MTLSPSRTTRDTTGTSTASTADTSTATTTVHTPPIATSDGSAIRSDLAGFLRARRDDLQPEDVGLPRDTNRRVRGLRRDEVARLAGMSVDYYTRIEQGRDHQMSNQVADALARALRLDALATQYFQSLVNPRPRFRTAAADAQRLLEGFGGIPAYVFDHNMDIIATNALGSAITPGHTLVGQNLITSIFSTPHELRSDRWWWENAHAAVAGLRFNSDPADPRLHDLIGGISVRDRDFRTLWAAHVGRPLTAGTSNAWFAPDGPVELSWQVLTVADGLRVTISYGAPGSRAAEAISALRDTVPDR